MTIPVTLLNKTFTEIGFISASHDDYGDAISEFHIINSGIKMRLSRNKDYQPGALKEQGYRAISDMKGFILPSMEVSLGNYLYDWENYRVYEILHINEVPGGLEDHHKELYLRRVEKEEINNMDMISRINIIPLSSTHFSVSSFTPIPTILKMKIGEDKDNESNWSWLDLDQEETEGFRIFDLESLNLEEGKTYYFRIYVDYPYSVKNEIFSRIYKITTEYTAPSSPEIIYGPISSPSFKSCIIEWSVNAISYHRVCFKEQGGEETITDWSTEASLEASIEIGPLEEGKIYYFKIQSCLVGDGSVAFDWYPENDWESFTTLTLLISDVTFDPIGRTSIAINCDTNYPAWIKISGTKYDSLIWSVWYEDDKESSEPEGPHSYSKRDLTQSTSYKIKISAEKIDGDGETTVIAYAPGPTSSGYYKVKTAPDGGLEDIQYE